MKKYTRKGLIKFYEKLPPRSRPCKWLCPIAAYMRMESSSDAVLLDPYFSENIDACSAGLVGWGNLTAARIVKIAKAAPHV